MTKKPKHEQAQRLFQAVEKIRGVTDTSPSNVAKELHVSQQVITNWSTRGLPDEKILELHETLGCSVMWLWKGLGAMMDTGPAGWAKLTDAQRSRIQGRIDEILDASVPQKNIANVTNPHISKNKKEKKRKQQSTTVTTLVGNGN